MGNGLGHLPSSRQLIGGTPRIRLRQLFTTRHRRKKNERLSKIYVKSYVRPASSRTLEARNGGRRMIYIVCRYCGKHDLVPKCVNEIELCFSCIMDVLPYD